MSYVTRKHNNRHSIFSQHIFKYTEVPQKPMHQWDWNYEYITRVETYFKISLPNGKCEGSF